MMITSQTTNRMLTTEGRSCFHPLQAYRTVQIVNQTAACLTLDPRRIGAIWSGLKRGKVRIGGVSRPRMTKS